MTQEAPSEQREGLVKIAEGREAEMFEWGDGAVLRLLRSASQAPANALQTAALRAAEAAGAPVPAVFHSITVNDRPGLVMERVQGTDLLTRIGRAPWTVFSAGITCGRVHAQLHQTPAPPELPSLKDVMHNQIAAQPLLSEELRRFALEALVGLPDGDRLCHGDFHPGNIILSPGGPVVIDWTNARRGDRHADIARTHLMIRIGDPPPGTSPVVRVLRGVGGRLLLGRYLSGYRRLLPIDAELMRRWAVPVAAARLSDGIEVEARNILRFLERARSESS